MKLSRAWAIAFILLLLPGIFPAGAQEFEPRTYSVAPVGLNFFSVGYGFLSGAVFLDPSLPIEDVESEVHLVIARYVRTLEMFGRPTKMKLAQPWSSGHWDGLVEGEFRTRDTTGFADTRVVIETLFAGAEAMSPAEMADYVPDTVWGLRLQLVAPTGEYDSTKAINLGANRWGLIPEIGFSRPVGKWSIEGAAGAWLFGDNDDFYGASASSRNRCWLPSCMPFAPSAPGSGGPWPPGTAMVAGPPSPASSGPPSSATRGWRWPWPTPSGPTRA